MVANFNKSNQLFIPDKKGGAVAQRAVERWGQSSPGYTLMALINNSHPQTISPIMPVNAFFDLVAVDGIGNAGFGKNAPYPAGNLITFSSGLWSLTLIPNPQSFAPDDQWSMYIFGNTASDDFAIGPIPPATTASFTQAPYFCSMVIPNMAIGGWQPAGNGSPKTAVCLIQIGYQGPQSSLTISPQLIVSQVSH